MKLIIKDIKGIVRAEYDLNDNDYAYDKGGKSWVGYWDIDFIDGNYVVTGTN